MRRGTRQKIIGLAVLWIVSFSAAMAGSIPLAWDGVAGAYGYRVGYGDQPGNYNRSFIVQGAITETSLSGLADCSNWYVAVKSRGPGGESLAYSNEVSGWPTPRLDSYSPTGNHQGSQFTVDLFGANFRSGAELRIEASSVPTDLLGNPLIRLESVAVLSCHHMQAMITVEPTARGARAMPVGAFPFRFEITNPDTTFRSEPATLDVLFDQARWDINRSDSTTSGRVDGSDLTWLAYAYGSGAGHPRFSADADLNGDGFVDGLDLAYLATGFGRCWSGNAWNSAACQ